MEASREFSLYAGHPRKPRRWLAATIASLFVYASVAAVLLAVARLRIGAEPSTPVRLVDKIKFLQQVPKREAPPAPVAKPPPAAAAPIARPEQKVRHLEKPPPAKRLVAPREVPAEPPKEAESSEDKGVAVLGAEDEGDVTGLEGGVTKGGVGGGIAGGVVELPDDATPPRLLTANAVPPYPPEARSARKSGLVVLKVTVFADGRVGDIQVLEGEEPFVSAALQTVKSWRYEPARYKGRSIAVYRVIRIPFKLTG
jgi:protein TonB